MRSVIFTTFFSFCCFGLIAGISQYTTNAENLRYTGKILRHWAAAQPLPSKESYQRAVTDVLHRSIVYESLLRETHLLDGMVVNRTQSGHPIDECDSLLFSSLRYVALKKLRFHAEAGRAWSAIENSQVDGHWRRHPKCWQKSTSRDMLLGLIAALTQKPAGGQKHLGALFTLLERNKGFISDGPIYVSYLTPGMARLLRRTARVHGFPYIDMPDIVRRGYSTNEWALPYLRSGYRTHLAALAAWVDLELAERYNRPLSSLERLSHEWITYQLIAQDPKNLFFRYLRLRSTGALTPAIRLQLLNDLAAMKPFPLDRLPADCDRRADYLWQRDSREYQPRSQMCNRTFAGIDFLWMAALLLEAPGPMPTAH